MAHANPTNAPRRVLSTATGIEGRLAAALLSTMSPIDGNEGSRLFEGGSRGTDLFLVEFGTVALTLDTAAGLQPLARVSDGGLVGEIAHVDAAPRPATARVARRGRLWRLEGSAVAAARGSDRDLDLVLLRLFCRSMSGKIRQAHAHLMEIISADGEAPSAREGAVGAPMDTDTAQVRRVLDTYGYGSQELRPLARLVESLRFGAGEAIFTEGEPGDTLCIVADGKVRISKRVPGAGEEAVAILGPGEIFGEMAWVDSGPRSADAIAHTGGCEILMIDRRDLDRAVAARTETGAELLHVLAGFLSRRFRAMGQQLVAYRTMAAF